MSAGYLPSIFSQLDVFSEILGFLSPVGSLEFSTSPCGFLALCTRNSILDLGATCKRLLEATKEVARFDLEGTATKRYLEVPEFRLLVLSRLTDPSKQLAISYNSRECPWMGGYEARLGEAAGVNIEVDWATVEKITWSELKDNVVVLTCGNSDSGKSFRNLEFLPKLVNLETLKVKGQNLDLSGIEKLQKLKSLSIQFRKTWKNSGLLSQLSRLAELEITSSATCVSLSDIGCMEELREVRLYLRNFCDTSRINKFPKLKSLKISTPDEEFKRSADLVHLNSLAAFFSVERVTIDHWRIHDVQPLKCLPKMTSLSLFCCTVSDYSAIAELTSLRELELYGCNFFDLSILAPLHKLEILDCRSSHVKDLTPLEWLPPFKKLYLPDCEIEARKPLIKYLQKNPGIITNLDIY